MTLIRKPKEPNFSEHPDLPADPVLHLEHLFQESVDAVESERGFRRSLEARRSEESASEQQQHLEKREGVAERRALKAKYWMDRILAESAYGVGTDWDEVVRKMRVHDPRTADFVAKLVAFARKRGALRENEE